MAVAARRAGPGPEWRPGWEWPGQDGGPPPLPLPLPLQLFASIASHRITAGGSDTITGLLTSQGRGLSGQPVTLLERAAGQTAWRPAGQATTGSSGLAMLAVPDLTANAAFRLTGPGGARSQPVRVVVALPVGLAVASGPGPRTETLTASSPLAGSGAPVILQIRASRGWANLGTQPLSGSGSASFTVRSRRIPRRYRAVLLPTASHGLSASNPVEAG